MYTSTTMGGTKKVRPSSGYLVRPRLGLMKSLYSGRPFSTTTPEKRKKVKKSIPKMEYRKKPDYADNAYRDAVSRLRILLAESYTPVRRSYRDLDSAGEETDNQSLMSAESKISRPRRYYPPYYPPLTSRKMYYPHYRSNLNSVPQIATDKNIDDPPKYESTTAHPELMSFIERQEDYIEQLEKESSFCKTELTSLLSKVKDVISENETLHERQKSKLMKSVFDQFEPDTEETETETEGKNKRSKSPTKKKKQIFEGPPIVFESRISELEAQLTQARIDLKKALEENESYRRKIADGTILEGGGFETYKKEIGNLQRDKQILQESVAKLENTMAKLKNKECDTTDAVKRSLDAAEHAQYEKNAADLEIRRLKDELERQHSKLRDAITDQSRRISDERSAVERRYTQQMDQLTTELGVQWETTNKLQLELDKQRRDNGDLRRECAQKQALIDELRKEMQSKIITLQSDIGVTGAEKSALEQQISSLQLANERNERHYKQEIGRLQAEMQSLRQRSDRADADLIHSRRENLRLNEQVASLEKEMKLNAALSEESMKKPTMSGEILSLPPPTPKKENRDQELGSMIHDLESKHEATVAELEGMIKTQNQLMDKLSTECQALTEKLEDANTKHKEEIRELQTSLELLNNRLTQSERPSHKIEDEKGRLIGNSQYQQDMKLESPMDISRNTNINESYYQGNTEQENSVSSVPPDYIPKKVETDHNSTRHANSPQINNEQSKESLDDPNKYQDYVADPEHQYDPTYISQEQYNQPEYDPNQHYDPNYQYHTNADYQTDPNGQYLTDPNQQYSTEPNQNFSTDPRQEYPMNSNQQFSVDPNERYAIDPSQQYIHQNQDNATEQIQQPSDNSNELYSTNKQYNVNPDLHSTQQDLLDPNQQTSANYQIEQNQSSLNPSEIAT